MKITEQLFEQFSQGVNEDLTIMERRLTIVEDRAVSQADGLMLRLADANEARSKFWEGEHRKVSASLSKALQRIDELKATINQKRPMQKTIDKMEAELKALKEGEE